MKVINCAYTPSDLSMKVRVPKDLYYKDDLTIQEYVKSYAESLLVALGESHKR